MLFGVEVFLGDIFFNGMVFDFMSLFVVMKFGIGFIVCDCMEEFVVFLFFVWENMFLNFGVIKCLLFFFFMLCNEVVLVEEIGYLVGLCFNDLDLLVEVLLGGN